MKLEKIEIKNYRSLFVDAENNHLVLELGDGMNSIVGPNNCGKSNVFRALAVALDEKFEFNRSLDMPSVWDGYSKPVITLTFRVPEKGRPSMERTLLKYLEEYERELNPALTKTLAQQGIFKLRVTIEVGADAAGSRRTVFVVQGVGARSLPDDHPKAMKALKQFTKCCHFVLIRSGQSLESLLEGKFRDILRTVLLEHAGSEFAHAQQSREDYVVGLQDGLLKSLTERIDSELQELFPEIKSVNLVPDVGTLDDTLTRMRVEVGDAAVTDLAEKGTGVRGGLIVAILRHLADTAKRSMIFAVEEPETFLHPAAQESLREDLEALAQRDQVSLIVATHSPYIVSREPDAKVIALDKGPDGRTAVVKECGGSEQLAGALGGLFRGRVIAPFLDRTTDLDEDGRGVLIVEGGTDVEFLRIAARAAGREDLLDGITIIPAGTGVLGAGAGGASLVVMQALVARSTTSLPIVVLLDNDDPGLQAANMLAQIGAKTKDWKRKKNLLTYHQAFTELPTTFPVEAEDLWPQSLLAAYVGGGNELLLLSAKSKYPSPIGGWRYELTTSAKWPLVEHLDETVKNGHCDRWVAMLELINKGFDYSPSLA